VKGRRSWEAVCTDAGDYMCVSPSFRFFPFSFLFRVPSGAPLCGQPAAFSRTRCGVGRQRCGEERTTAEGGRGEPARGGAGFLFFIFALMSPPRNNELSGDRTALALLSAIASSCRPKVRPREGR